GEDLRPLFEAIVSTVPPPGGQAAAALQVLVANLDYNDYLGRIAIARVFNGTLKTGEEVGIAKLGGSMVRTRITKMFSFNGLKRAEIQSTELGDIIAVAGVEGIAIGDTITDAEAPVPLPRIRVDEPTLAMQFSVNTSPFAGRDGTFVTSRHLRERLEKEVLTNVSLRVEETDSTDAFKVMGRGELHLAILIETIRRRDGRGCPAPHGGAGGRPAGRHDVLRPLQAAGARGTLCRAGDRRVRRHNHRRKFAGAGSRRQRRSRKASHQHAGVHRGRGHPPCPDADLEPGTGDRVYCRRRTLGGH